mgnify:CR=1 FL=1
MNTIYKIYCLDSDIKEFYIGSSKNFKRRKTHHKSDCNNEYSRSYNYKLYKFIRANGGYNNFDFEILLENIEDNIKKIEQKYIKELQPVLNCKNACGYDKERKKLYQKQYRLNNKENKKQYRLKNKEKIKEYNEKNKQKIKEQRKDYYETNKEKISKQKKEYNKINKEKIKEYDKQRYQKNKQKKKEYRKQYYQNNKEKNRLYYEKNKEKIKEYKKQYRLKQKSEKVKKNL